MPCVYRSFLQSGGSVARGMLFGLMYAAASSTFAGPPPNVTAEEEALRPKYCMYTQGNKERYGEAGLAESQRWTTIMGPGFSHMHHYCYASIWLLRAGKPSLPYHVRRGMLEEALADLLYVAREAPPDFILLPEVYTKIGQTQLRLKFVDNARASFEKARSLKPDYWPAYFHWAEYLRSVGETDKARSVVDEGLAQDPQSKPLQELRRTLGSRPIQSGKRATPSQLATPQSPEP